MISVMWCRTVCVFLLRSFGHQGALYYVFLASDPLKTSREYAVFTLRTRGPKVCTRETSRQTQRVNAFFVLIAPNDRITSYIAGHWRPGQNFMMFQRMKNETWFSKNGNIKNLMKVQKWGRSRPIMYTYFCFVSFESCIIRSKYSSIAPGASLSIRYGHNNLLFPSSRY